MTYIPDQTGVVCFDTRYALLLGGDHNITVAISHFATAQSPTVKHIPRLVERRARVCCALRFGTQEKQKSCRCFLLPHSSTSVKHIPTVRVGPRLM